MAPRTMGATQLHSSGLFLPTSFGAGAKTTVPTGPGVVQITGSKGKPLGISHDRIYETQPVVGAVVNKLVRHICRVPLRLGKGDPEGEYEIVEKHPALDLVRRPARRRRGIHLKQWMALPLLVQGNSLMAKYRGDGAKRPPTELLPLDWRYMSAYCSPAEFVDLWVSYQLGEPSPLTPDDVVHTAWASVCGGTGGEIGISPLQQLGTTIRTEDATQRYQAASFEHAARPSGAVVVPPDVKLDDPERAKMRDEIRAMYEGVDNAFRVALLTGGVDWKAMSFTSEEAELISTRALSRMEVCMVYDVSPTVIGDLEHGTLANVAENNRDFYGNTLGSPLQLMSESLTAQLLDTEEEWADQDLFFMFDTSQFLRGDPVQWAEAMRAEVESGGLTLNERRKLSGRKPSKDPHAEELVIATNNLSPISQIGESSSDQLSPADLATELQKIYLAVGVVITADEAREILNRQGANLPPTPPELGPKTGNVAGS